MKVRFAVAPHLRRAGGGREAGELARERIQASADRAGREVDPEHFGMSVAYARTRPEPEALSALTARRSDVDPLSLVPLGEQGLRAFIHSYVDAGLSKFVVRSATSVESWAEETEWLTNAIIDLQT